MVGVSTAASGAVFLLATAADNNATTSHCLSLTAKRAYTACHTCSSHNYDAATAAAAGAAAAAAAAGNTPSGIAARRADEHSCARPADEHTTTCFPSSYLPWLPPCPLC